MTNTSQKDHYLVGKSFMAFTGENGKIIMKDDLGKVILVKNRIALGYAEVTGVVKDEEKYYIVYAKNIVPTDVYPDITPEEFFKIAEKTYGFKVAFVQEYEYGDRKELNFLLYNPKIPAYIRGNTYYNKTTFNNIVLGISSSRQFHRNYVYVDGSVSFIEVELFHCIGVKGLNYPLKNALKYAYYQLLYNTPGCWPLEETSQEKYGYKMTVVGPRQNYVIESLENLSRCPEDFFTMFSNTQDVYKLKGLNGNVLVDRELVMTGYLFHCTYNKCRNRFYVLEGVINLTCPKCGNYGTEAMNETKEFLKEKLIEHTNIVRK